MGLLRYAECFNARSEHDNHNLDDQKRCTEPNVTIWAVL